MTKQRVEPWPVVLIVEDDSDGRALRSLAEASGLPVRVDWLPANGIGNIRRRLDALVRLASDRIESGRGCVAVVVDRDGKDCRRHEPHRTICRTCGSLGTPYIEAVETIEAWFLADGGIMNWLGLEHRKQTDRVSDPKSVVSNAFHKKTGRSYGNRLGRTQLAAKATGVRPDRSASWASAMAHLSRCSATQRPCSASPRRPRRGSKGRR